MLRRARERQKLGLSISEYNALTPRELKAELAAAAEIEKRKSAERELKLKLFDTHLATLEMLTYNANFKGGLKISNFEILKKTINDEKPKISEEVLAFDAKLRAKAQAKFRQKLKGI